MTKDEVNALMLRLFKITSAEHGAIAEDVQDAFHRLLAVQVAAVTIYDTFEKDEAQGYRSRSRQFAIDILRPVLNRT